eukprot:1326806-Amorphochlora_amoeboformis.AAC.1
MTSYASYVAINKTPVSSPVKPCDTLPSDDSNKVHTSPNLHTVREPKPLSSFPHPILPASDLFLLLSFANQTRTWTGNEQLEKVISIRKTIFQQITSRKNKHACHWSTLAQEGQILLSLISGT